MKKYLSFFLILVVLFQPSLAFSEEEADYTFPIIAPVKKDDRAPFTGVLLTPEAVAKIIATARECDKKVSVETEHARDVQRTIDERQLADLAAERARDSKVHRAEVESRDAQIKILTESLQKNQGSNSWLFVGLGAVVGVLSTVGLVTIFSSVK